MNSLTQAKLRTKTGCLTCRRRRKKCTERYPICERCALSGRQCDWPTASELLDTRFATQRHGAAMANAEGVFPCVTEINTDQGQTCIFPTRQLLINAESDLMRGAMAYDLKQMIINHFVRGYFRLILLPNCHPRFYDGFLGQILNSMLHEKSLFHSVLACAASHLHFIDGSSQMQHLALTCYTTSIAALSKYLAEARQLENQNGLLTCVILLYLHGCLGQGTLADVPFHVNAAARILTMRLICPSLSINWLIDRIALESVLNQMFLIMTGLWSESPGPDCYSFDMGFWTRAESVLVQSPLFPGDSTSLNSPVLGVPVPLLRLVLLLRQLYLKPPPRDMVILDQLRPEVETWETGLLFNTIDGFYGDKEQQNDPDMYYRDACYLYSIIASVLFQQLLRTKTIIGPAPMASDGCWKVKKAVQIIRSHQLDDGWQRCYIGNWPVYTLGFFISSPEDKNLIRADLQRRWDLQHSAQICRLQCDLEMTWVERQHSDDGLLL